MEGTVHEPLLIVEVDGHSGERGEIIVRNRRAATGAGQADRLYCVAALGGDGVLRFVDWGYATSDEARAVWPDARHTSEFRIPS